MSRSQRKHSPSAGPACAGAAALSSSRSAAAPHCLGHTDRLWLDQLLSEGDPGDLISMLHRYRAWLDLEDRGSRS